MFLFKALLACLAAASTIPTRATLEATLERGHALYFQGDQIKALEAYAQATKLSSGAVQPWLNGAVVLEELGRRAEAVRWYAKASQITADPAVLAALGWARWRAGEMSEATEAFARALGRQPDQPYALLGKARVELDRQQPENALRDLQRAAAAAPLLNVASYYQGKAYEQMREPLKAQEAYKQSVIGDSYFTEGREALARVYWRGRFYNEAWRQLAKILDAEPRNKKFLGLIDKIRPLLTRRAGLARPAGLSLPIPYLANSQPGPLAPTIRVGLYTNPLGKPKPRQSLAFKATCDFDALDARTGKRILSGEAGDAWQLKIKKIKRAAQIALIDDQGKAVALRKEGFLIRPKSALNGIVALDAGAGKLLRGQLEVTLFHGQLRLVNILDLENYTHGVVAAEMPIKSPLEALKAQAIIARSHALFIKKVTRRHRKEGYDVCDEQHCQVYLGARAESARSRDVVNSTRGRIVTFKGEVAHVIYSSNCGGHTQSGKDLVGWGDVPYWAGIADAPAAGPNPRSPWDLRQWLRSWPPAFCKPSADVHASHFRWTRLVPWKDLADKLDRRLKTGALKSIRATRRSPSGNVNLLLVEGSRKRVTIDSELQIRGLLGLGSLRSTQFVIDYEYDKKGKPQTAVFHGGGWGHGVGLCQSGAMGRADAGQTFEQIIKAYFRDTELGQLAY